MSHAIYEETSKAGKRYKSAKEKALHKAVKGPQHLHQKFGKMARELADISGETDSYRTNRSIMKHELKEMRK